MQIIVCLKFSAKGSVLQARKERVQLGQGGALGGFQLFHGSHAAREFALEVEGWDRNQERANVVEIQSRFYCLPVFPKNLSFARWRCEIS